MLEAAGTTPINLTLGEGLGLGRISEPEMDLTTFIVSSGTLDRLCQKQRCFVRPHWHPQKLTS